MTMTRDKVEDVVRAWARQLLYAMSKASTADAKVQQELHRIRQQYSNKSEAQLRYKLEVDYVFNDILGEYRQWCSEVQRFAAAIQAVTTAHTFLTEPRDV